MNNYFTDAQILKDTVTVNNIREGIENIYNLHFEEAETAYNTISKLYPGHPVLHLYKGMMIYWKNYPLFSSSPARSSFETEMNKCIELSDKNKCPDPSYEAEYLLSNLCSRGLLLLFYADNDLSSEVIFHAQRIYRPLMESFRYTSACSDFFYFTGIYNYYRDAYPRIHPIYKTVALLFPPGNMELGLTELENAAENAIAMKAESYFILSWIMIHFENNYDKALHYCEHLTERYPSNVLYKAMYIKNLLLLKKYDEAENLIPSSSETDTNSFFLAQLNIFWGLLQEKKYHNYTLAQDYYKRGISDISAFGAYGNDYAAYAYFGLSRISRINGNDHERRMYRRKAMGLVDFKKINFDE